MPQKDQIISLPVILHVELSGLDEAEPTLIL